MCGIVGYVNLDLPPEERLPLLRGMCDPITHRGPDDDGYFADDRAGLGMRRLSIIDLAGGRQPIANEDGSLQIVFNGEIYNYQDLRPVLEARGHRFSTASDTEVILHQYEEDGPACVHRLNGMFAFAIWDGRARRLFLARDRLGIKPLYYYWDGRRLLFASEIKALLASGYVERRLNPQALWDYLTFRYVPQPETIWLHVHKLPPGHTLTLSPDRPEPALERYWDIPYADDVPDKDDAAYLEEFEALFLDAVRLRLIADVPVGILLSGGLDSSAVAAAIAAVHNARLNSFSVAFQDSRATDERPFARLVAEAVGTEHHEVVIGEQEFLDFLPRFVHYTDEPLADLASVPLYYVSRLARQTVKVVLSGEGSDEILAGYHFDWTVRAWNLMRPFQRLPRWLRQDVAVSVARLLAPGRVDLLQKANLPLDELHRRYPPNMTHYLSSEEKRALWRGPLPPRTDSMAQVRAEMARPQTRDPLHRTLYLYCQSWLVEDLLMKADRMTMANSLELRVPFLDYRLVEWAARAPSSVKVRFNGQGRGQTKWVLRRFAASRLPQDIITRQKQGFPVPVYDWLGDRLKPWATGLLQPSEAAITHWLEPEAVRRQMERGLARDGSAREKQRLWNLLILELWMRAWQPG